MTAFRGLVFCLLLPSCVDTTVGPLSGVEGSSGRVFVTDSCSKLSRLFGPGTKLSDVEREKLWNRYRNKAFRWTLRVTEVNARTVGGYSVQYKCAPESPSLIQDLQINYNEDRRPFVLGLSKDQSYEILGVLSGQSPVFGLSAADLY